MQSINVLVSSWFSRYCISGILFKTFISGDNTIRTHSIKTVNCVTFVSSFQVPANDGKEVTFDIKPVEIGDIPIEVHIRSTLCRDALRKNLKVEVIMK